MARYNVTCCSSNLIYCISCKRCGIQYVGQTKSELKKRLGSHFDKMTYNRTIKKPLAGTDLGDTAGRAASQVDQDTVVGLHFRTPPHQGILDVEIHIVDFIHAALLSVKAGKLRNLIEFNWIQRLHTNAPVGLNIA